MKTYSSGINGVGKVTEINNKIQEFYHILICAKLERRRYNVKNIKDLEPFFDTLFIPYQNNNSTIYIDGCDVPVKKIQSLKVFVSAFELDHIDEVYADYDRDFNPTHDAKRHKHDITQKILSEAIKRSKPRIESTSSDIAIRYLYRVIGIVLLLLATCNSLLLINKIWIPVNFQHAFDIFIFCVAVALVWKGKWEWKMPHIVLAVLGAIAGILAFVTTF